MHKNISSKSHMHLFAGSQKHRKVTITAKSNAEHLADIRNHKLTYGMSATKAMSNKYLHDQFVAEEAKKGRATAGMSKSAKRTANKVMKQNIVYNPNPDNKCQTKARIKAKCVRNAYTRSVVSYVEREGERKDVSGPVAKANPVIMS